MWRVAFDVEYKELMLALALAIAPVASNVAPVALHRGLLLSLAWLSDCRRCLGEVPNAAALDSGTPTDASPRILTSGVAPTASRSELLFVRVHPVAQ